MNNDDLPPISSERWREKFSSGSEDFREIIPPPEGVPEILMELNLGKISSPEAERRLVQLGFSLRSAQLTVEEHLQNSPSSKNPE